MDQLDASDIEWRQLDDDLWLAHWRAERLLKLGYELGRAASLGISEIDIHQLERLIENGCPPEDRRPDRGLERPRLASQ